MNRVDLCRYGFVLTRIKLVLIHVDSCRLVLICVDSCRTSVDFADLYQARVDSYRTSVDSRCLVLIPVDLCWHSCIRIDYYCKAFLRFT